MASANSSGAAHWMARGTVVLAFLVVLGTPFVLRNPQQAVPGEPAERPPSGLPERGLIIISPHNEAIRTEFERGFNLWAAENHGFVASVDWLDVGGTMSAIKYVDDQFKQTPQGIQIDIFFGGGVDPFLEFGEKNLLRAAQIPDEVLEPIPQTYAGMEVYDARKRWFGACLAGFGLMYNKPVLDILDLPQPYAWEDLGRAEYFSWVASADPRHSGSMHMVYEIILQAYGWQKGWEVVTEIGANCRGFSRQASDVPAEVSSGEAACGMAIDLYALQAIGEVGEDRLGFRLPDGLTVVNPDGIGILKGAPHPETAELFIEFVMSPAGQRLWVLRPGAPGGPVRHGLFRLPVIPGFAARFGDDALVRFDPFEFEGGVEFDPHKKNVRWRILNDLLGAYIIDVHDELAAAWKRLRNLPPDHPRRRALMAPPISEEQLLRYAERQWNDHVFRADTIARWSREAQARYRRLREGD